MQRPRLVLGSRGAFIFPNLKSNMPITALSDNRLRQACSGSACYAFKLQLAMSQHSLCHCNVTYSRSQVAALLYHQLHRYRKSCLSLHCLTVSVGHDGDLQCSNSLRSTRNACARQADIKCTHFSCSACQLDFSQINTWITTTQQKSCYFVGHPFCPATPCISAEASAHVPAALAPISVQLCIVQALPAAP